MAAAAELLREKRYADDIADSIKSMMKDRSYGKKKVLAIRGDLINTCKRFGFAIKLVISTWDTKPDLMEAQRDLIFNPKDKKERFFTSYQISIQWGSS